MVKDDQRGREIHRLIFGMKKIQNKWIKMKEVMSCVKDENKLT